MNLKKILDNAKKSESFKAFDFNSNRKSNKCIKHLYIARERGTPYCKIGLTKHLEQRMKELNVSSYGGFKVIASAEFVGNCYVLEDSMKKWFAINGAQHGEGTEMFVFDNCTDADIRKLFNLVVKGNISSLKGFTLEKVTKNMSRRKQLNILQA